MYDRDGKILKALEAPFRFVPPDDLPAWTEGRTLPDFSSNSMDLLRMLKREDWSKGKIRVKTASNEMT